MDRTGLPALREGAPSVIAALLVIAGCAAGPMMSTSTETLPSGRETARASADATRQASPDTVLYASNRTERAGPSRADAGRSDVGSRDADAGDAEGHAPTADAGDGGRRDTD